MKSIFYLLQGSLLSILMFIFGALPLDAASNLGGWIGRTIGPLLGVSKRARKHLEVAFPGMPDAEKKKITLEMWDNLGRVIGEYPHLEEIAKSRVTVKNEHIVKDALARGAGAIFISAHIGNWETHVPALLARHGVAAALTYRGMNNPHADNILRRLRTLKGKLKAFPKARESGRALLMEMKNKGCVAILIDQKFNEGVEAHFFGKPAMTNPVFVQLAQKFRVPLIAVQCERTGGANFELCVHVPLKLFDDAGAPLTAEGVIAQAHAILEGWIRETPGQWLWLHRRWRKEKLTKN